MANVHEESLLSESLSLEDLHGNDTDYDEQPHKFGIVNTSNLAKDANASGDDAEKIDKEVSLLCNAYSTRNDDTLKSSQNQAPCFSKLPVSNIDSSDSYYYHSSSSCSVVEDTKDQLPVSVKSTNSSQDTSLSMTKSDFSQLSSTTGVSKNWVIFDDNHIMRHNGSQSASLPKKPPDIPRRKLPPSDQLPAVDLLSLKAEVPPIPNRLLTPQRVSVGNSSVNSDIRIPPPPTSVNTSIKRQSRSRSSVSTPSQSHESAKSPTSFIFGPPVPPRKDILQRQVEHDSVSDLSRGSDTSSLQGWIKFEHAGSSQDELIESGSLCTNRTTPSQPFTADDLRSSISSLNADSSIIDTSSLQREGGGLDDSTKWLSPSSPDSPKSSKKKKKGYQHLSSGSEEEADKSSVIGLAGDEITIEVTDLSPAKPLSRWALMRNEAEDKSGSSGDISARNSMLDPHDELDLDDAFGLGDDRLSTDGSGLKGFNRADKGSQNNLVDFSESAEHLDSSACEDDGSSENELETVFDMTAEGDSLKRRRKKKVARESTPSPKMLHSTSSVSSGAKQLLETSTLNTSSIDTKQPTNQSTNPFWRHSPMGDTISLTSSTSETNPFDRVQFQSAAPPSSTSTPQAKTSKTAHIPTLPPPPKSTKQRNLSSSLGRPRRVNNQSPHSLALTQSVATQEEHRRASSVASSLYDTKLDSSADTPVKSDTVSLLDLAEDSFIDGTSRVAESTSSPRHQDDDIMDPKVEVEEPAGPSRKESNFFETALQILDVSPNSPPLSLANQNINAHHVLVEFPILGENALNPLEKLFKKPVMTDSPIEGIKELKRLKRDDFISNKVTWDMLMRHPREKHPMSSRRWVPMYVKLNLEKTQHPVLQLLHSSSSDNPFYSIPLSNHDFQLSTPTLRPRFKTSKGARKGSVSSEGLNPNTWHPEMREVAYYNATKRKVHCVKVFRTLYKEKRAFSTKKDKYMTRIPSGFKHSLKQKQVVKLGTENYADMLSFLIAVSDASFKAHSLRKDGQNEEHNATVKYHSRDEIMLEVRDDFLGEVTSDGTVEACDVIAHVYVTSFLTGDPLVKLTFNNKKVEGKEVVQRKDIIPISNTNWIEMNDVEVHRCSPRGFEEETAAITFHPPDACRFELARFRSPFTDREPPLVVRTTVSVTGHQVTLRCGVRTSERLVDNEDPMFQVPCDDISIRFSIPDAWVPAFRRVGLAGYKSIHATRWMKSPTGREKVLGGSKVVRCHAVIEASAGSGKYEAAYNALVWRIKRIPEKNAVANAQQVFMCIVDLENEQQVRQLDFSNFGTCTVEYTMPWCTASKACIRSISVPNCPKAERFPTYGSHYLYNVQIATTDEGKDVPASSYCAVQ